MKIFLKKLAFFFIPIILYVIIVLSLDIFKIFKDYNNYYNQDITTLNRTYVSTKIFQKNKDSVNYDSFIFGSSRSQAFKTPIWKHYLPEKSVPFHYDAHSEDLYGIYKKLEFLDDVNSPINHALIIIDRAVLSGTIKRLNHLYINPVEFNDVSKYEFYSSFILANLNPRFMMAYADFYCFKTYRNYMKNYVRMDKYPDTFTPIYNDSYYGLAKEIKEDSLGYYNKLKQQGVFYQRPQESNITLEKTKREIDLLNKIKSIFNKHDTNYKIVVSPLYDQIPMEEEQLVLLYSIFDKDKVFDFSGKNNLTEPISNYFESSHYKPNVAKIILDSIY
ncbi:MULTISPECIES: hypothetical protein [unclassified Olleya]|jgi:hypothetical protein|uniref:hypothetical protein n=1 Tax=unclassified Olleya TaxID=2615019 RepID=UPI00119D6401|nr:hypothetical protein [Olleya sp. Hel_I_94]TVZ46834.1 hypothetical protein JM82_1419 [Olleya sp. Hel_I_94]